MFESQKYKNLTDIFFFFFVSDFTTIFPKNPWEIEKRIKYQLCVYTKIRFVVGEM